MRRAGVEDEFKPVRFPRRCTERAHRQVEQLLEDFEKRKADAVDRGEDVAKVEETRKYLGGDATHSVLVKGLDFALLAARKAELERQSGDRAEEELEEIERSMRDAESQPRKEPKKAESREKSAKGVSLGG